MPRIYHVFDPFAIRIAGEFGIRWYSLAYLLGFVLVRWYLGRAANRGEIRNLTVERLDTYVVAAFVAALVGARVFHVFVFELDRYGFDPAAWIAVWRGGLAYHGGLVGVVLATLWFARSYRISFYELADRAVIPVAVTLGFGRIANFINAEMYGTPYEGPFCVDYGRNPHLVFPPEGCRHPTQLYQTLKNWLIAGLLLLLDRRYQPPSGTIFWTFVALYGSVRFFLMFLREEERILAGLTLSQIFSGLMGLLGFAMLAWLLAAGRSTPGAGR